MLRLIHTIISLLAFGFFFELCGQNTPSFQWLQRFMEIGGSVHFDVAAFSTGESVVVGIHPYGQTWDGHIIKYTPTGQQVWRGDFQCSVASSQHYVRPLHVSVDVFNNIYIAGYFYGTIDFDPTAGVYSASSSSTSVDGFLMKLDSTGTPIWFDHFTAGSSLSMAIEVWGLDTDLNGNVIMCGSFMNSIDLNPGAASVTLNSNGDRDLYFVKLDGNGNFVWGNALGGAGVDVAKGIKILPTGEILVAGNFESTVDFDPGSGVANKTATNSYDSGFLASYSSSGGLVWVNAFVGTGDKSVFGLTVDAQGDIFICGDMFGITDFDGGSGTLALSAFSSNQFAFVAKYAANGNVINACVYGSTNINDPTQAFDIKSIGNELLIVGMHSGTTDFDPSSTSAILSTTLNGFTSYVSSLNSNLQFNWARNISNATGCYYSHSPLAQRLGFEVTGGSNLLISGGFNASCVSCYCDFDPNATTYNVQGDHDAYLVNWSLIPSAIHDIMPSEQTVFYNSATRNIIANFSTDYLNATIGVYDISGRVVVSPISTPDSHTEISFDVSPGLYFVEVNYDSKIRTVTTIAVD